MPPSGIAALLGLDARPSRSMTRVCILRGPETKCRRADDRASFWAAAASSSVGEGDTPMQRRRSAAWRQRKPPLQGSYG
jgi:hypothetical protein